MADPEEIQEWLDKAKEDRQAAEVLLNASEELTLPCMFHLQQMLEKLLKALILVRAGRIEHIHDLSRLAYLAGADDIERLLELSETLNMFAVTSRYPGDLPLVDIDTAHRYYKEAAAIRELLIVRIQATKS